jgi:hypothetical protein
VECVGEIILPGANHSEDRRDAKLIQDILSASIPDLADDKVRRLQTPNSKRFRLQLTFCACACPWEDWMLAIILVPLAAHWKTKYIAMCRFTMSLAPPIRSPIFRTTVLLLP